MENGKYITVRLNMTTLAVLDERFSKTDVHGERRFLNLEIQPRLSDIVQQKFRHCYRVNGGIV